MASLPLKSIKKLWLWNTPHLSNKHLATLRDKGVKIIWDGRFKQYKTYSIPKLETDIKQNILFNLLI